MSEYSKIIGHENIISQLISAVSMSKINHAYIFNGPDGSGKNMLAKAFAQALLCEKQGPEGWGEWRVCKQTEAGTNPDLIYIRHSKENIISVDDIRESLVQDIQIKPYNGLYKVYIIDEAEKLTVQAQNALLKTIEEPPEYSVLIFLTNNADIFLQTILSRCIVFNLKPLRDDVITDYLIKTYKIADYEAKVCSSFAQGILGKAIRLFESEDFNGVKEAAVQLVKNIYSYEIYDLIEEVKMISQNKVNINDFIDILEMWYRDVILFKVTKDPNNLIFKDEINYIRKAASKSSYEGLENIINGCEIAKSRIKANVNFDLAIELMLLNIKEN